MSPVCLLTNTRKKQPKCPTLYVMIKKAFFFMRLPQAWMFYVFLVQSSNRPLEKLSWLGEWNPAAHWSSSNHPLYSCAEIWHKTNLSLWLLDPCMLKSHFRKYFSQLCIHPVQPSQQDAEGFGREAVTWFCCQTLDNGPEKNIASGLATHHGRVETPWLLHALSSFLFSFAN